MPQLRIAIVENEPESIRQLKEQIFIWSHEKGSGIELSFQKFAEGEVLLQTDASDYHVIFMDIQLDGQLNGVETATRLRQQGVDSELVFLTSFQSYALSGYRVGAIAYIIKPVAFLDLKPCMDRVLERIQKVCFVHRGSGIEKQIPYEDILYFQSSGHYIEIVTKDNKYRQKGKLETIMEHSPPYFVRCHRINIVNVRWIDEIRKNEIRFRAPGHSDYVLSISSTYRAEVSRIFMRENN